MQRLRRLLARRRAREDESRFAAEGVNALSEALAAGHTPETVFIAPGGESDVVEEARRAGAPVEHLSDGVIERISDAVTPQPVVSVFPFLDRAIDDVLLTTSGPSSVVVVTAGVRDPGNLGTILRSAEASGATGVVCCDGTVDLYNPKTVRASTGAIFHVPVVAGGEVTAVMTSVAEAGYRRLATSASNGDDYTQADLTGPIALVVGNEAHGVSDDLAVDGWLTIPIEGRSESLNVGMATAVICFEAARQRRAARC